MIIMGIDPGTATTGWGAVEKSHQSVVYIEAGIITTQPTETEAKRLLTIYEDFLTLLKKFKPQAAVLEELFFNTNAKTALTVGQARGVIMLVAVKSGLSIYSYTPLQVKMAITGYGRADKNQIQHMVKTLLKLPEIPKPDDAADALAVALTHCFSSRIPDIPDIAPGK